MLRKALRERLARWRVGDDQIERALLVIDELVSNAIEHGAMNRTALDPLAVRAEIEGKDLLLELEDPEVPAAVVAELKRVLQGDAHATPPLDNERGRGLFLIATWLDRIEVLPLESGGMRLVGRIRGARA